jgi:acyl-CoA thioesterase I
MNPLALYFASGESLYPGFAILLLIIAVSRWARSAWHLRLRNIAAILSLVLILLSGVPLPYLGYGFLVVAFVAWFIRWHKAVTMSQWGIPRVVTAVALAIVIACLAIVELPYRYPAPVTGMQHGHLTVIGDSISAGIGGGHLPWPVIFQKKGLAEVRNLSRAGIGVEEAYQLAAKVTPDDTLVLLEIGGNDVLGSSDKHNFERNLDLLLSRLATKERTLVMFELPLPPLYNAYGKTQRRLAEKYHVHLIPRRFFISVLAGADATSDGLHLSNSRGDRMCELIDHLLGPVLSKSAATNAAPGGGP